MKYLSVLIFLILSVNGYSASVTATIEGGIISYIPSKGQIVKKGDFLVKFDQTSVLNAIKRKKFEIAYAEENLKDKFSDYKRYEKLSKKNAVSLEAQEDITLSYYDAKNNLEELKVDLYDLESNLSDYLIKAPCDCRITKVLILPNCGVRAGQRILSVERAE